MLRRNQITERIFHTLIENLSLKKSSVKYSELVEYLLEEGLTIGRARRELIRLIYLGYLEIEEYASDLDSSRVKLTSENNVGFTPVLCQSLSSSQITHVESGNIGSKKTLKAVVTVPLTLTDATHKIGVTPLISSFDRLIRSTKRILRIVSPFIDVEGVMALKNAFSEAAMNGVNLRLLTRQVILNPNSCNYSKILAIGLLSDIFGQKIEIRDFHKSFCIPFVSYKGTKQFQYESIHAKKILCDDREAYIGSGEIRGRSLFSNYEFGLVFKGRIVRIALDLFNEIWERSKSIHKESINEAISKMELS